MEKWEEIVLIAMNGAGVPEEEALTQLSAIKPIMENEIHRADVLGELYKAHDLLEVYRFPIDDKGTLSKEYIEKDHVLALIRDARDRLND